MEHKDLFCMVIWKDSLTLTIKDTNETRTLLQSNYNQDPLARMHTSICLGRLKVGGRIIGWISG